MSTLGIDFSDPTLTGVLAAVGVILAAVAAVTGLVSVWQGRRSWRTSRLPELQAQRNRTSAGVVQLTVVNAGGGVAAGTSFLLVSGNHKVRGALGLLAPGARRVVHSKPTSGRGEELPGLVSCFQPDGAVQTFFFGPGAMGRTKVYRRGLWRRLRRRPWPPEDEAMFAKEYPDVALDDLTRVEYSLPMLTQPP